MLDAIKNQTYKLRTLFLSDIHLGSRNCKAKMLRHLLNCVEAEAIYLIGDIIDGERLRLHHHWPQSHEQVLDLLHHKAAHGTKVVYIPGNHDEGLRGWLESHGIGAKEQNAGLSYHGITYKQQDVFTNAQGQRHLLIHGDQFDGAMRRGHAFNWLYMAGDLAYDGLAYVNRHMNHAGEAMGLPYWSLPGFAKKYVKKIVAGINKSDEKMIAAIKACKAMGSISGHTHTPRDQVIEGLHLRNDGDMVDSITAITEDMNGQMRLLDWAPVFNDFKRDARAGGANPQRAFAMLAEKHGAIPTGQAPHLDFLKIPKNDADIVPTRYAEIIEIASHGLRKAEPVGVCRVGAPVCR